MTTEPAAESEWHKARDEATVESCKRLDRETAAYAAAVCSFMNGADWGRAYTERRIAEAIGQLFKSEAEIRRLRGLLEDAERDLEEAANDLAIAYADAETYVEHECLPSEDEIANLKRGYEDCMIALKKIRAALASGGGEG